MLSLSSPKRIMYNFIGQVYEELHYLSPCVNLCHAMVPKGGLWEKDHLGSIRQISESQPESEI